MIMKITKRSLNLIQLNACGANLNKLEMFQSLEMIILSAKLTIPHLLYSEVSLLDLELMNVLWLKKMDRI